MDRLGLDFGTTNSTLAFIDTEGRLRDFHPNGQSYGYIPTVVAYGPKGEVRIGRSALSKEGERGWTVRRFFKMLLNCDDQSLLEKYGYKLGEPEAATKAFISRLISDYREQSKDRVDCIQSLVITAPEIWIQESRHKVREFLRDELGRDLGIEKVMVRSEPQAAIAYFAFSYQSKYQRPYQGHVVVCDCGGGTLDFCLANVGSVNKISVLQSAGSGASEHRIGNAGVAFDEGVVDLIAPNLHHGDAGRSKFMREFETKKIDESGDYKGNLEAYLIDPLFDEKLFSVCESDVTPSAFKQVFDERVLPSLSSELRKLDTSKMESESADFRVIMVGGFSNFLLTQNAIKDHFGVGSSVDKRYESCFTNEDLGLAIAKGAALISSGRFEIDERCPIGMGFIGSRLVRIDPSNKSPLRCDYITIIKQGDQLSRLRQPRYDEHEWTFEPDAGVIRLFYESLYHGRREFSINASDSLDLLNNKGKVRIGFSVDEDGVFHMHLKQEGAVTTLSLGHLLEELSKGPIMAG